MIDEIRNLPDIDFIENKNVADIQNELVKAYEGKYAEIIGENTYTLPKTSPMRILLNANAFLLYQSLQYIDRAGKQGMLKYSYGDYLDNLGALKGVKRKTAQPANVTVRFEIEEARNSATAIPAGTRVTAGDDVFFETTEYIEISSGSIAVECKMTCLEAGSIGNGYDVGDISILVDPIAYISSVSNVSESFGGSEIESDESFKERIYLAPSTYSSAGTLEAYYYFVKNYSSEISDASITTDENATVNICVVLKNEKVPSSEFLSQLKEYISSDEIKPLTDKIEVTKPKLVDYGINCKYFICESDRNQASKIQYSVNRAIESYQKWQSEKIGRDINPDKLKEYIMSAGAKRVEITSPSFRRLSNDEIASLLNGSEHDISLSYENGGIDDLLEEYIDTTESTTIRTPANQVLDLSDCAAVTITADNALLQDYNVVIWFCDSSGMKAVNNIDGYHKLQLSKTFASSEFSKTTLSNYIRFEIKGKLSNAFNRETAEKVIKSIKVHGSIVINYGGIEDD